MVDVPQHASFADPTVHLDEGQNRSIAWTLRLLMRRSPLVTGHASYVSRLTDHRGRGRPRMPGNDVHRSVASGVGGFVSLALPPTILRFKTSANGALGPIIPFPRAFAFWRNRHELVACLFASHVFCSWFRYEPGKASPFGVAAERAVFSVSIDSWY